MEDPDEYVDFMAKYRGWVSIKRMGIRSSTRPEEISFHLASIRSSIDGHAYSILGIGTDRLDSLAKELASGKSKTYDSAGSIIKELSSPEMKKRVREACENDTAAKLAASYVLNRALLELNYETSLRPETMAKLYPELKFKPPRGAGRRRKPAEQA